MHKLSTGSDKKSRAAFWSSPAGYPVASRCDLQLATAFRMCVPSELMFDYTQEETGV